MGQSKIILIILAIIITIIFIAKNTKRKPPVTISREDMEKEMKIFMYLERLPKTMLTVKGITIQALFEISNAVEATASPAVKMLLTTTLGKMIVDIEDRYNELDIKDENELFAMNLSIDEATGLYIKEMSVIYDEMDHKLINPTMLPVVAEMNRLGTLINVEALPGKQPVA